MMSVKRLLPLMLAAIMLLALLAGCSGDSKESVPEPSEPVQSEEPSPEPEASAEPEPEVSEEPEPEPEPEPEFTNRFTGLPEEKDTSLVRPFAIVMNNIKKATPQCGISKADVIIEVPAEGGVTRLLSIFTDVSAAGTIGSIRSMRPYIIDFAKCLTPIYIHAGGSDDAYKKIKGEGVTNIDGVNGSDYIFFRDKWRKSNMGYEHSLMINTSLVPEYLEKKSIKTELSETSDLGFKFGENNYTGGTAEDVKVNVTASKTTSFAYSADNGYYRVSQHGGKMTDSETGDTVTAANILVLKMAVKTLDSVGRLAITSTGSGTGYIISGGRYGEISWSRSSTSSPMTITDENGNTPLMTPGRTYVCIQGTDGKVEFN